MMTLSSPSPNPLSVGTVTTTANTGAIAIATPPPSNGKKKKKKLSKSERKRRKRARELKELQEKNQKEKQQEQQQDGKSKNDALSSQSSPKREQVSVSAPVPSLEKGSPAPEPASASEPAPVKDEQSLPTKDSINEGKKKKDKNNFLAINKDADVDVNNIDTTKLLKFVLPKSKKDTKEIHRKPYIHAKLRKKNNSNGDNNDNKGGNSNSHKEKEMAISMGVADESIDDIFSSPKQKKRKKIIANEEEKKCQGSENDSKTNSDSDSDNDKKLSTPLEKEKISKLDSVGGDSNDEKSTNSSTTSSTDSSTVNDNSSVTKSPNSKRESLSPNGKTSISEKEDYESNKKLIKPPDDEEDKIVQWNDDTPKLFTNERRKRSMSEDSSNDQVKPHLSGFNVEMAVKDKFGRRPRCNSTDGELNLPRRGLCDEQKVMGFHKWDMGKFKPFPPRGFHNLGNTCFLNATLQCLAHLPTFCQVVASIDPSQHAGTKMKNQKKKLSNGQLITLALRVLLKNVHGLDSNKAPKQSAISPKTIANSISLIDGSNRGYKFRPGRQEDAHEFLVHLLDAMNDGELKAAGINQKRSGWRDRLPIPRLDETTFVHRMFGGYLRSQVCCTKCNYKSNTYDPFLDLSLEVSSKKVNSVYNALNEYMRKETLDTANKWKCSGCKKKVCATKQLTCFRPPVSLCIQLKRFSFGGGMGGYMHHQFGYSHFAGKGMGMQRGGSKIQKSIEFPAELKLPLSDGRKCEYELTGVVIHVGHSATSGHYTAFVRRPMKTGSQWYHMDDSFVEPVKQKRVLREKDAYVLFYCRKEVKLNLPNPPSIYASAEEAKHAGVIKAKSRTKLENKNKPLDQKPREDKNGSQELKKEQQPKASTTDKPEKVSQAITKDEPKKESQPKASSKEHISQTKQKDDPVSENASQHKDTEPIQEEGKSQTTTTSPKIKSPSKSKGSKREKKALTLDQGSKRGSIQVLVGKLKRKKSVWKPSYAQGSDTDNVLLGNTKVSKWDDEEEKGAPLREAYSKQLKREMKSRKRKMYLDSWDAGLDEGRIKKVREKQPIESYKQLKPDQNQFHRIQHSLMQMNRKGRPKGNSTTTLKRKRMKK